MKIRLSDGTVVGSDIPSRRAAKGSRPLKKYNSYQSLVRVGGVGNDVKAIYHGYENGTTSLCVVREPKTTTVDLGGSCSPRYRGGRGA